MTTRPPIRKRAAPICFRPSAHTRRQLEQLAKRWGETRSAAISKAIDRAWVIEFQPATTTRKDNHNMIYITAEHLGDVATNEQAERMAELLRERGFDVSVGTGTGERADSIPDSIWEECLDIISRESY